MNKNQTTIFDDIDEDIQKEAMAKEDGETTVTIDTILMDAKRGKWMPNQVIANYDSYDEDDEVIVMILKTDWKDEIAKVFTKSTNSNSKLTKFVTKYGKPSEGDEVELYYDEREDDDGNSYGFWKIDFSK